MLMFAGLMGLVLAASVLDAASCLFEDDSTPEGDPEPERNTGSATAPDAEEGGEPDEDDPDRIGIDGTPLADILVGTGQDDRITGANGDDQIGGYQGDDEEYDGVVEHMFLFG